MHPDREIVRMYRRSDGLPTRPYELNTLTLQYSGNNDAPRDPLCGPTAWIPSWKRPTLQRGPAQNVPFFYTPSHFSELQSCKLIISTEIYFIFIVK